MASVKIEDSSPATKTAIRELVPQYRSNTAVLLGDSLTTLCQYNNAGTFYRVNPRGWIVHTMAKLNGRMRVLDISAVNGDKIADAKLRIPGIILKKPAYCVCMVAVNDAHVWVDAQGYIDAWVEYRDEILEPLIRAGITPVACTISPSDSVNTAIRKTGWHYFNNRLRDYNLNSRSTVLADLAANTYADPANGTAPQPAFMVDAVHPNVNGAELIGDEVARALAPAQFEAVTNGSSEGDEFNFSTLNGCVFDSSKTSGGLSGTPTATGISPTGWTFSGLSTNATGITVSGAIVPSVDSGMDWFEGTISGTGMSGQTNLAWSLNGGTRPIADLIPGDWVEFGFDYEVTALNDTAPSAGLMAITAAIRFFNNTTGFSINYFPRALNGEQNLMNAQDYKSIRSTPFLVPQGTTDMRLSLEVRHQGSQTDVSSTVKMRNSFIRKIDGFDPNNTIIQP